MSNNNKDSSIANFDAILLEEHNWIAQRRKKVNNKGYGKPSDDAIGLGLSGGGIRSAIFNLGLLQAFDRYGFMPKVDYLSTVSGGGYIGACYTWMKSLFPNQSPLGTSLKDYKGPAARVQAWLRLTR